MTDIYNDITVFLISDSLWTYIELGAQCFLSGFMLYSLWSLATYGIIQVMRLFNIN